jgi:NAD(P)-dependent dehydrogenase (short-subunit alcohol dehydrogenase family)
VRYLTPWASSSALDALRQEVAGFGIKVVIIEPGFVATSLGEAADRAKQRAVASS